MKKSIIPLILILILLGGLIFFALAKKQPTAKLPLNNVSIVEGKQVIEISAKGGYTPRLTVAQANLPTVIIFKTEGTFDCSAAVSIPSIFYRANLPMTGTTPVEIPPQASGTTLQGLCAMGMYNFAVQFN